MLEIGDWIGLVGIAGTVLAVFTKALLAIQKNSLRADEMQKDLDAHEKRCSEKQAHNEKLFDEIFKRLKDGKL